MKVEFSDFDFETQKCKNYIWIRGQILRYFSSFLDKYFDPQFLGI